MSRRRSSTIVAAAVHDVILLGAAGIVLAALVYQWGRVMEQIAAIPLGRHDGYRDDERRYDVHVLPLVAPSATVVAEVETGEERAMAA